MLEAVLDAVLDAVLHHSEAKPCARVLISAQVTKPSCFAGMQKETSATLKQA